MGKISSYTSVTTQSTDDLLVCDQDVSGTLTTMKTTVAKVGTAVAEVQNHANLPTTDKTLVGSITELDTDKPDTVTMTQSAWDAIADKAAWRNAHKNTLLILTDAPNLNATSEDLSYDGGATSTHDVIEQATNYKSIYNQTTYQNDIGTAITTLSDNISNFRFLRVIVYISSISSSSRGIALVANLKQAFGANYIPICINGTQGYIRIETTSGKSFTLLALSSTLGNSCCVGEIIGIY